MRLRSSTVAASSSKGGSRSSFPMRRRCSASTAAILSARPCCCVSGPMCRASAKPTASSCSSLQTTTRARRRLRSPTSFSMPASSCIGCNRSTTRSSSAFSTSPLDWEKQHEHARRASPAVLHATDPTHHKLIGGIAHFDDGMYSLTQLATIAAVLIGATAGAGDLASGFFRNLVVTGRPRLSLFTARIPGGLTVLLPITAVAYATMAGLSQLVPGPRGTPSTTLMIEAGLWLELYVTAMFLLALGLSSLLGSRATTLGILA